VRSRREPAAGPLSAATYLLRNPRRVVPVALVQALVTALLMTVITPTNVFETTSRAYDRVLEQFTLVTPRERSDFDEELSDLLDANDAMAQRVRAKLLWIAMPMIVGEAFAPLVAVDRDLQPELLERVGDRLVAGKLPERGSVGVALHRAILRSRGLSIGSTFGKIVDPEDRTPGRFEVVGELEGDARLGVIDLDYASLASFVLARRESFQVVYAKDGRKAESDRYLHDSKTTDGHPAFSVFDQDYARAQLARMTRNLPVLIGFLTGAVAAIAALVTSLLNVIAFHARLEEFGLFLAVGHRRRRLARKLAVEAALTSLAGWVVGLGLGFAALVLWRNLALEPKGILIELWDPRPLWFSLAVPVLSTVVSALALSTRLRRMDPVAVIQRRGA
jgi:hypothetical protein